MGSDETFCAACGADRNAELRILGLELTAVASARKWILGIGIWYVVSGLLTMAIMGDQLTSYGKQLLMGISAGLCVAHFLLYVWAKRQPLAAAIVAMVLFVSVQLLNAVTDPSTIYKGIIIKVLFVVVLVKAIQAGYEVQKLRGQRR